MSKSKQKLPLSPVIIISSSLVLVLLVGGVYFAMKNYKQKKIEQEKQAELAEITEQYEEEFQEEAPEMEQQEGEVNIDDKIQMLRKHKALKQDIKLGEQYINDGENMLALKEFLKVYKENPEDRLILEKLGDTYFAMNKYDTAVDYYEKGEILSDHYIKALFYASDLEDTESIQEFNQKIRASNLPREQEYYYITSAQCILDFHQCKLGLAEIFFPENKARETSFTYTPLNDLKTAISNYRAFELDDVYLKNLYMYGAWYQNDMFSVITNLGEYDLRERSDYKPLIKIVAQSYFKMGDFDNALKHLQQYQKLEDDDAVIAYMLGVIYSNMREYLLANIHLKRSIELGYANTLDTKRLLAYNYYQLKSEEQMLGVLKSIIEEESYSDVDLSLAAYFHIGAEEYSWVLELLDRVKEDKPNNSDIYAYIGWIQRKQGNLQDSLKTLLIGQERALEDNPFLLINLAYTYKELENNSAALINFKRTMRAGKDTDFFTTAQYEIDQLNLEPSP